MDEIIRKALSGNKKALNELYVFNKDKIYSIAYMFLDNKQKADKVVLEVFSTVWKELTTSYIDTEERFRNFCVYKTVLLCKKAILKDNPKALQPAKNQNYVINSSLEVNSWQDALKAFSPLQKFILLCRILCSLTPEEIAKIVNVDATTVKIAQNAESIFIEKTNSIINLQTNILNYANSLVFSSDDISPILNAIENYALPFETENLKKKIRVVSTVLITCVIIAVVLILTNVIKNNNITPPENNSEESSQITVSWKNSVTATDYAVIDIRDYGTISVALDEKTAPITVKNFKELANKGFYDGLTFHRIMEGFMMQGGDPDANGLGGSGKEIKGEFYSNGVANDIGHFRGAISMARSNNMDSASSQFFIVHKDSEFLNGKYAAFGFVVKGIEVVDKICTDAKPTDDNGTIPASKQPIINTVKIYSVEEYKDLFENTSSDSSENTSKDESASENASSDSSENISNDESASENASGDSSENISNDESASENASGDSSENTSKDESDSENASGDSSENISNDESASERV